MSDYTKKVAALNDAARRGEAFAHIVITPGVEDLADDMKKELFKAVKDFSDFGPANNPHGERDFGKIELGGLSFFWKFDYYDLAIEFHSDNAADPNVTARVLTIMLAEEY